MTTPQLLGYGVNKREDGMLVSLDRGSTHCRLAPARTGTSPRCWGPVAHQKGEAKSSPDKIYGILMNLVVVKSSTILLYTYEVGLKTS